MTYLWLKAVHVLAVIAWMAGLFYLPRLFVYHAEAIPGSPLDGTFKIMERRLLKAIMRPAGLAVLISGPLVVWQGGFSFADRWLSWKLIGVVLLFAYHGLLEYHQKTFVAGGNTRSTKYFRLINEVPTVLLIWIVIFAVVKPLS